MEYRLEIYAPSSGYQDECVKVFTSTAPFPGLQVGDFLDMMGWEHMQSRCLRVLSVEHAIVEKAPLGIDPSGNIVNRTVIHAEGVPDRTRHEASMASDQGR